MGKESYVHSDVVGKDKDIVAKKSKAMTTRLGVNWTKFRDVGTYEELGSTSWINNLMLPNTRKSTGKKGRIEGYGTTAKADETPPILPCIVFGYDVSEPLILKEDSRFNEQADTEADSLKLENASLKTIINELRNQIQELQELLSNKYSSKKLLMFCITASIALGFNLAAWYDFGVYLIHPALTIIGLIGTVGFGGLAFWRGKCQTSQP